MNHDGASNCARARAVANPFAVTVSADGKSIYAAGGAGSQGALAVFARDAKTGALRETECVLRMRTRVCKTGLGMETPAAVAVSPDGRLLVTAAQNGNSIGLYRRAGSGALTPAGSVKGFGHAGGLAFRADGKLLLVTDGGGLTALRPTATGFTVASRAKCELTIGCNAAAFSPDGRFAYAVSGGGAHGAITSFAVALDGTLAPLAATLAHAIEQPLSVAVSRDGRNVYVAASVSAGVAVFARDATTGVLTQIGCVTASGSQGACAKDVGLAGAASLAVSRDGKNVYVASYASSTVVVFARGANGALRETETLQPGGASRLRGVALSPDGRNVYAVGRGVAVLRRR